MSHASKPETRLLSVTVTWGVELAIRGELLLAADIRETVSCCDLGK